MDRTLTHRARTSTWIAQIVAAGILGMTLPFKLTGAAESVALFTTLGAEPYGRIGLGLMELAAVILLLVPRTAVFGGLLTSGILTGAVLSHLTILGVVYRGDASLFTMAVVGLLAGSTVSWVRRREIPVVGALFGESEEPASVV